MPKARCPGCSAVVRVGDESGYQCPHCQERFVLPRRLGLTEVAAFQDPGSTAQQGRPTQATAQVPAHPENALASRPQGLPGRQNESSQIVRHQNLSRRKSGKHQAYQNPSKSGMSQAESSVQVSLLIGVWTSIFLILMVGGFFLVAKFIESPTPVASNEKKQGDKTLENQTPASVPLEQTDEAQEGEPLSAANDPVPEVFEAGAKKTNKPVKRGPQERAPKDDSGNRLAMQKLPDPPYMAALQSGGAAVRKPLWEPSQPPQNSSQRLAPEGLSDVDEKRIYKELKILHKQSLANQKPVNSSVGGLRGRPGVLSAEMQAKMTEIAGQYRITILEIYGILAKGDEAGWPQE